MRDGGGAQQPYLGRLREIKGIWGAKEKLDYISKAFPFFIQIGFEKLQDSIYLT